MKRFYSYSFGCRVNQAEKEELDRQLMALGYQYSEQKPDYFIINTCSVTHKAEREAKQLIYQVKRNKPATKIVVTGCAATNWIKQGIQLKEVDLIVDNQSKEYIASLIQSRDSNNATIVRSTIGALKPVAVNDKYLNSGRIILKIQDGCHRFCSFCIVPYLRGLPKSTRTDELIKQINSLDPSIDPNE
jgi:threonylcarbamoyladenosine tRNA methylthiotransferase MtaB